MATKLGSALRAAREAKGLSLREFDGRSGCRLRRYLRIENGIRKDPAFSTVAKLARSLGVSLDSLAGGGAGSPAASRVETAAEIEPPAASEI